MYPRQVAGTYQVFRLSAGDQSVAHRGEKLAVHIISQLQSMGTVDIQSPVTAPVNINHYLLSPGVLAADVERGAAIAVTVTGQRLNTGRHLQGWETAPIFYDAYGKSKYRLHD